MPFRNSIFRLQMDICRLKTRICRLQMYIFRLKMEFLPCFDNLFPVV